MYKLLQQIQQPNDIKKIEKEQYPQLAKEIRHFLVQKVSRTGGHLASNLGAVELTMALHLCCDLPKDKIIWDVGHQSYTHKLLTGRIGEFDSLRQYQGLSGFPKPSESDCDAFITGHSSTSVSAALGMAKARDLSGMEHKVIAVIGDGALSGGMAYEALNNAAELKSNLIIILNDNNMSISKNVGGMANYLGKIRTSSRYQGLKDDVEMALLKMPAIGETLVKRIRGAKDTLKRLFIPGMLFEDMGLTYIGPIDGHDIGQIEMAVKNASAMEEAVIIHVHTRKGKGYRPAEKNPSDYHGVSPFDLKEGVPEETNAKVTYTDWFSETMQDLGKEREDIVAVCAAMPDGTGLSAFAQAYPDRFFDVGIAEEHAVTFAAGMAAGGLKPVVAVYSTFFQRAYDQILHDVCIGRLPVVFAVDRAGIVGNDGETHQGIFDLSFLSMMPNMTVLAPKNGQELEQMLHFAAGYKDGPVAVRYPRGMAWTGLPDKAEKICYAKAEILSEESGILLWAAGSMVHTAWEVKERLQRDNYKVSVVNARFIKPFDEETLAELLKTHNYLITLEENTTHGGMGSMIAEWLEKQEKLHIRHHITALPDEFIPHGNPDVLKREYGLDVASITDVVKSLITEDC